MDELKKYLQQHAPELDLDEPREQVWQQIREEVQAAPKPNVVMMITRWAAAACVLVLAGIGGWHLLKPKPVSEMAQHMPATHTPSSATIPVQTATEEKRQPEKTTTEEVTAGVPLQKQYRSVQPPQAVVVLGKSDIRTLDELENSFTQVINLQRAKVDNIPMYAETPEYFSDFKVQMHQMEKDEKAIKADIAKHGLSDELLGQLINLYQQKLNTLKQLQIEMNKTNNRFKQNRGPVDSAKTYFLNI